MENDLPNKGSDAQGEPNVESIDVGPKDGFPDKESDLHYEIAIGRNTQQPGIEQRYAVELVWRDMANGGADRYDRDEWLSYIAKRIVSSVIDNPDEKGKASAALMAIGLFGRRVQDSALLYDLDTLMVCSNLFFPDKKMSHQDRVDALRHRGHFKGLSDSRAVRKIQNLLRNRAST